MYYRAWGAHEQKFWSILFANVFFAKRIMPNWGNVDSYKLKLFSCTDEIYQWNLLQTFFHRHMETYWSINLLFQEKFIILSSLLDLQWYWKINWIELKLSLKVADANTWNVETLFILYLRVYAKI